MSAFSNYLETEILDWINGNAFATQPSATWVQLFNGSPTETGLSGTALYSRVAVAAAGWTQTSGATATITNTAAITITTAATTSAYTDFFGVFDNSTSGNLLFYGELTSPKSIASGDEVKFNASSLTLRVD